MSKKSRRRNKILLGAAALFGASKLGLLGGKTQITGAAGKDKRLFTDIAKKGVAPQKVNVKKSFPRLKVDSIGNVTKDGVTSVTKNKKSLFINRDPKLGTGTGIYQGGEKVKSLNQKAINVLSDGKIESQGKTFEGKKEYRKFMDEQRAKKRKTSMTKVKDGPSLFGFRFDKPLFKSGSMIKARGGGMARTKPTKMY